MNISDNIIARLEAEEKAALDAYKKMECKRHQLMLLMEKQWQIAKLARSKISKELNRPEGSQ